ncbi:hypothetical protein [Ferrovibrio terrae]|uniref:hypothetical protein n=1 Tax=Ferrovibrio terrae TaxID=2594003 RepID=UPI003137A5C4
MRKSVRFTADSYISTILGEISSRGLRIDQDPDLTRWRAAITAAPGNLGANISFDPAHHDLDPGGPHYWLRVTEMDGAAKGRMSACIAFRLIETGKGGWMEWLASGRLFSSRLPPLGRPRLVHPADLNWRGRIGHHGGLWVHPERRGENLPYLLTHLIRALSVQRYDVDHHCGLVFDDLRNSRIPLSRDGYGYTRVVLSLVGFVDAAGKVTQMHTTHIDRRGMDKQIAEGPMAAIEPARAAA